MFTWKNPGRPLVLASQSPRRKEILLNMGLTFTTVTPAAIDENAFINRSDLRASLERLARAKAESVADSHLGALVLGADTVVVKDDHVLGKPADRAEAGAMLKTLSGACHQVLTGVALVCRCESFIASAVACTDVFFRTITGAEIDEYLCHDEYRDKAGAYAIQGRAMIFVERIAGCYYNVVGLPVSETISLLSDRLKGREEINE
jgi:septum formation protein